MEERLRSDRIILKGKLRLNLFHNDGIAFSKFRKYKRAVKLITGTMLGVLCIELCVLVGKKESKWYRIGISLIVGGGLSNLIDRCQYGYVVDYFSFNFGKKLKNIVFNLADMFIFIGSILCIVSQFRKGK